MDQVEKNNFIKLGIDTVSNLLAYFPRSYEDRRKIYSIKELETGITAGVVGTVVSIIEKRPRPRLSILEVIITDGSGPMKIVLFNQGYKKNFYKKVNASMRTVRPNFNMVLCR